MTTPENFEGYSPRECGEHRTVGTHRAWCHECAEWCYPELPCKGCELPQLRAENERLTKRVAALVHDRQRADCEIERLRQAAVGTDADPEFRAHASHDGRGRNDCPYCLSPEEVAAIEAAR